MGKKTPKNTVKVKGNFEGNSIQGDGNTVIKNDIDNEGINQGLLEVSDAIYENSRLSKWEYFQQQTTTDSVSREIQETISIAFFSGLSMGVLWHHLAPFNVKVAPLLVLTIAILFSTFKLTHLGLRQSIIIVMLISAAYSLLLNYIANIQIWMGINHIVGGMVLGTIGAGIGLVVGVIQMFWKPLGD